MKKKDNILLTIWRVVYRVFLVLLFLFPIAMLAWVAFKSASDIALDILGLPKKWIGFENFATAIDKMDFLVALKNSLVVTIASTLCLCIFPQWQPGYWSDIKQENLTLFSCYFLYLC